MALSPMFRNWGSLVEMNPRIMIVATIAKRPFKKFNSLLGKSFVLHSKECELRVSYRDEDLLPTLGEFCDDVY
jgi:hypothetical protein